MIISNENLFSFGRVKLLIDNFDYDDAIKYIKSNLNSLNKPDDFSLAFLYCGFLSFRLKDFFSAIEYFSSAINREEDLDFLKIRSKDIPFNARSDSKYKIGDYKGAIEDKRKAIEIRLLEETKIVGSDSSFLDFNMISSIDFDYDKFDIKYQSLFKISKEEKRKYDLIEDYKKVISSKRKMEVIKKLQLVSESKYMIGDYKGSIRAIRRAEKYY